MSIDTIAARHGAMLAEGRRRQRLTLREVARRTGLDFTYISKIEHGRDWPSDTTVRKLAEVCGLDPEPLLVERAVAQAQELLPEGYVVVAAAEAERLRAALHVIAVRCERDRGDADALVVWAAARARAALEDPKHE